MVGPRVLFVTYLTLIVVGLALAILVGGLER
jgi:hypothetical protein